jgi:hypothetical protein
MKNYISKAGEPTSIISRNGAIDKPAPYQRPKTDPKDWRRPHEWRKIPESVFFELSQTGRAKYRDIVVVTFMALLWNGWDSKKKKRSRRIKSKDVMVTRRLLAEHFGLKESTAKRALSDLLSCGLITVSEHGRYTGNPAENRGTRYRLPWMDKPSNKGVKILWGLIVSDAFESLSVPAQAIIILLHALPRHSPNRLTIQPCALSRYGIHRNRMRGHLQELTDARLLVYIEVYTFEFAWIDDGGELYFNRLNKNSRVAN